MHHLPLHGPVREAATRLPGLARLQQRFEAHGRVVALTSRVAPAVPTEHAFTTSPASIEAPALPRVVVDAVGVAVRGTGESLAPSGSGASGWQAGGPGRWTWAAEPRLVLTLTTTAPTAGPSGHALALRFAGTEEDDRTLVATLDRADPRAGRDVDVRPAAPAPGPCEVIEVAAAAEAVRGRALLAVTGAGLSAAAGIRPFFGPDSLDADLGLLEPFPGRLVERMVREPVAIVDLLARWHLAFLRSEPTPAHRALADLERRGHLAGMLTTNVDRLHQAAHARRVAETAALTRARPPAGAGVLVVGSANDPGGVLARARAAGGVVVALDVATPAWAQPGDLVVHGDPQRTVPALAAALDGLRSPLSGLGDGWIAGASPLELVDVEQVRRPPDGPWAELPAVADRVRNQVPARRSRVHGPRHWLTVAWIGAVIAASDASVDPLVVALFALFHDCARTHDGHDPEHGRRGAGIAKEVLADVPWLTARQHQQLELVCADHTAGRTSDDPTVGACWDADRLDLWRVGATPSPALLSHPAAAALRSWSRRFTEVGDDDAAWDDWRPVCAAYAALAT